MIMLLPFFQSIPLWVRVCIVIVFCLFWAQITSKLALRKGYVGVEGGGEYFWTGFFFWFIGFLYVGFLPAYDKRILPKIDAIAQKAAQRTALMTINAYKKLSVQPKNTKAPPEDTKEQPKSTKEQPKWRTRQGIPLGKWRTRKEIPLGKWRTRKGIPLHKWRAKKRIPLQQWRTGKGIPLRTWRTRKGLPLHKRW